MSIRPPQADFALPKTGHGAGTENPSFIERVRIKSTVSDNFYLTKVLDITFRVTEGAFWQGAGKIWFCFLAFSAFACLERKKLESSWRGEYQDPFVVWQKTAHGSQEPWSGRT